MRKYPVFALTVILMLAVLSGCGKPYEPQYKKEVELTNVNAGMIPQIIENTVTYVQKEKNGEWVAESSEITDWRWDDSFNIQDTVWIIETADASSLYSGFDSTMNGVPLTLYTHFKSDLRNIQPTVVKNDDGSMRMDISFSMTGDMILEFNGQKVYLEGVKILGCELFMDGSSNVKVDAGESNGIIHFPSDVKRGAWKDFYNALPTE